MRIYLDTCSLQRPLDDKSQLRIQLEAEAILRIIDLVEGGIIELLSSDALTYETKRNPFPNRRQFVWEVTGGAVDHVELTTVIEKRAQELIENGIKTLDALHLASAEAGDADFFCTCDDSFLNKAKSEVAGSTIVASVLELAEEIERWLSQRDR